MELGETELGTTQELGLGEELLLRLPENPTTGFRWQVSCGGDGQLQLITESFEPSAGGLPGAAGQRSLRYIARARGTVLLRAVHQRSWEPAAEPPRPIVITIR